MNKKILLVIVSLALIVSISLVYAQENGYLINITDSAGNINTNISNSTVVENVTLTNGTLNLQINADNISSVTINGVNYTAQTSPLSPQGSSSTAPTVIISYYGMNNSPFTSLLVNGSLTDSATNETFSNAICYSWNITMVNLSPSLPSGTLFDQALESLVAKYPMLLTKYIPNAPGQGLSTNLTLMHFGGTFNGNLAKLCLSLYSKSELSSDQINALTNDLTTQLTPAIIQWYS